MLSVISAEERQLFNCLEGRKRLEAELGIVAEILQFCASVCGVHSSACNSKLNIYQVCLQSPNTRAQVLQTGHGKRCAQTTWH